MPQTRPKPLEEEPAAVPTVPAVPPASAKKLDEFEAPGGKFMVNGKLVNHEGLRIREDGSLLSPDELAAEV